MKNNYVHIAIAASFILLLVLLCDPFMVWMPAPAQMTVILAAAVLAALWSGFVMYERAHDERDSLHMMRAGRAAYLSGIFILTLALLVQGFEHDLDGWVLLALGAMVTAKLAVRLYDEHYR
jgi:hypothetical protein